MGEGWQGAREEGAWGPGRGAPTVPVPVPGLPHRGCLSPGLSLIPLERGVGGWPEAPSTSWVQGQQEGLVPWVTLPLSAARASRDSVVNDNNNNNFFLDVSIFQELS